MLPLALSNGHENDWVLLYETAFPADERTPVEELRRLIQNKTLLLHKTVSAEGELLCFSLVNLMSKFAFLAYIATDTTKRSSGVGSKHMRELIGALQTNYPHYSAMFLEIESTKESGLHEHVQTARERRLKFYQRLDAKRLEHRYSMPSYARGVPPTPGELLWIELTSECVPRTELPSVVQEIFTRGYGLDKNDEHVLRTVEDLGDTNCACCAVSQASSILSSETPRVLNSISNQPQLDTSPTSTLFIKVRAWISVKLQALRRWFGLTNDGVV